MKSEKIKELKRTNKMFSRGDRVTVTGGEDGDGDDEHFPGEYRGMPGAIGGLDVSEMGTPRDPFYTVIFDNGDRDGFWRGELGWSDQ